MGPISYLNVGRSDSSLALVDISGGVEADIDDNAEVVGSALEEVLCGTRLALDDRAAELGAEKRLGHGVRRGGTGSTRKTGRGGRVGS